MVVRCLRLFVRAKKMVPTRVELATSTLTPEYILLAWRSNRLSYGTSYCGNTFASDISASVHVTLLRVRA